MKHFTFVLSFFIASVMCTPLLAQKKISPSTIQPEIFTQLPSIIDACSGLYAFDTTALNKHQYIFATNQDKYACIQIKGKRIILTLIKRTEFSFKNTFREMYQGEGYTITLVTTERKMLNYDLLLYNGRLTIQYGKKKSSFMVYGQVGC